MYNKSKTDQLFELAAQIDGFDDQSYQKNILEEVACIYDFHAAGYITIFEKSNIKCGPIVSRKLPLSESDLRRFLSEETFSWQSDDAPYIGTFNDHSIIGVPFKPYTWGLFFATKLPLNADIISLQTFAKTISIWFNQYKRLQTEPSDFNHQRDLKRKYDALQILCPFAEWEWDLATNQCIISDSFLAFFDYSTIKDHYSISDLYDLMGDVNVARFKHCVYMAVKNRHQVLEVFKCPLINQPGVQHIQMLFDPVFNGDALVSITGYCRDTGRTETANHHVAHWFSAEWMQDMPLIPIEWELHSNNRCKMIDLPWHEWRSKEISSCIMAALPAELSKWFKHNPGHHQMNIEVRLPFSRCPIQLIATATLGNHALWRGFIIVSNEKNRHSFGWNQPSIHVSAFQQQISCFLQAMANLDVISGVLSVIDYLSGLGRYSKVAYQFDEFWQQIQASLTHAQYPVAFKKNVDHQLQIPHAQLGLSLVSFLLNEFHLLDGSLSIHCHEPAIVESNIAGLPQSSRVIELSINAKKVVDVPDIVQQLFQLALMGTGIDVLFLFNHSDWKCRIYLEAQLIESQAPISAQGMHVLPPIDNKTILIVDDDHYNIQAIEVLFQGYGFKTISANNGEEALTIVGAPNNIDAIVLDLRMPILDGFAFLSSAKNNESYAHIPIVVLSANITPDVIEKLNQFHVDAIIEKPFESDELIDQVAQVVLQGHKTEVGLQVFKQ